MEIKKKGALQQYWSAKWHFYEIGSPKVTFRLKKNYKKNYTFSYHFHAY
jgi:hypothetical protein